VAADAHRSDWQVSQETAFAAERERQIDLLADAVEDHLDAGALLRIIEDGG
jgi:adenosylcobyric acid synthase